MKRPYIGVIQLVDDEKKRYWMSPGYMNSVEKAGGIPLILPLTKDRDVLMQVLHDLDGLLLTGGHDVDPHLYHEDFHEKIGPLCPLRDASEMMLTHEAVQLNMPVFGICRGLQMLNVVLGGTLYQDIPSQISSTEEHRMPKPFDTVSHSVNILENTPLYDILGSKNIGVNSHHHQSIKDIAPSLRLAAVAEDGVIESIFMPNRRFILGVQWHPELLYDKDEHSRALFSAFVRACSQS